jgi:hypothetical protein
MQRKTQRPVQFEITEATRESLAAWVARRDLRSTCFLFPGRSEEGQPSLRQYSRIVKGLAACIGLDVSRYGTHSLRRTKAALIYKRIKNIRAIQLLLGHTKLESTVRYLGIDVDDALKISGANRDLGCFQPKLVVCSDVTRALNWNWSPMRSIRPWACRIALRGSGALRLTRAVCSAACGRRSHWPGCCSTCATWIWSMYQPLRQRWTPNAAARSYFILSK